MHFSEASLSFAAHALPFRPTSPISPMHNAASALLIRMLFPSKAACRRQAVPLVSSFVSTAGCIAHLWPWTTSTPLAAPAE